MILHVSHGAPSVNPDDQPRWFVVYPLDGTTKKSVVDTDITHDMAVESLLRAWRTVYEVDTDALTVKVVKP
ncbi:MAG TPA: hypothetical protein VGU90_13330 [Terriglobales bacterium]|nr:hypothetical protein [Terriglobales bacterium]